MTTAAAPLLEIVDLTIEYAIEAGFRPAVRNVNLTMHEGESLALLGDSGSGKTTIIKALLGLLPRTARIRGDVRFRGRSILGAAHRADLASLLMQSIGFVPQAAMNSLDPVLRIDTQFRLAMRQHRSVGRAEALRMTESALESVGIDAEHARSYPHQLSGGMRQRVLIAMAQVLRPALMIADEPTTGLDVIVQAKVLDTLKQAHHELDHGLLLITHDWDVAVESCDRIVRLADGAVILDGTAADLSIEHGWEGIAPLGAEPEVAATALTVTDLEIAYARGRGLAALRQDTAMTVLHGLDLRLDRGEILGIFGVSGSGKSTLISAIAGLVPPHGGSIVIHGADGEDVRIEQETLRQSRRHVQMVFQDPFGSLNPRWSAFRAVAEPVLAQGIAGVDGPLGADLDTLVHDALRDAGLDPAVYAERHPSQLSGGERQRVAIARALVVRPRVLIADEPVSMLDDATAREVMAVFRRLADEHDVAVLLVTHNVHILRHCCERVAVMHEGGFVEVGTGASVIGAPQHPNTRALVSAAPGLAPIQP